MGKYRQSGRPLAISTRLGADGLLLESFMGTEGLSQLFRFKLALLAEKPVDFKEVLGKPATITLALPNGTGRAINGIVRRLTQCEWLPGPAGTQTFLRYRAILVPALWMLTRRVQSRVFQRISVPDILKKVLKEDWSLDISLELVGTYEPRNYCVQYRESDFAFVSRLMEEEGICYFFKHSDQQHTLVLTDAPTAFTSLKPGTIVHDTTSTDWQGAPRIRSWIKSQKIRAARHTVQDWSFQLPDKALTKSAQVADSVVVGSVTHDWGATDKGEMLETFEYPAAYGHRFDGIDKGGGEQAQELQKLFAYEDHLAKVREERQVVRGLCVRGLGNAANFVPGCKFALERHFDADGSYTLTRVRHRASLKGAYSSTTAESGELLYENDFECLPEGLPYRPPRRTHRPRLKGTQPATVVGPQGEEMFVDKYGRVKVQFHWDRIGQKNADSSCWVRVSQAWAGQTWGALTLPRVGQEVIVGFEHGDPDRPLILGSVYNAAQMPPYQLPAEKSQSGLVSSSGAGVDKFHEIRLDDSAGQEVMLLHSQRDLVHESEHDHLHSVGNNHGIKVVNDQMIHVGNQQAVFVGADHQLTAGNSIKLIVGSPPAPPSSPPPSSPPAAASAPAAADAKPPTGITATWDAYAANMTPSASTVTIQGPKVLTIAMQMANSLTLGMNVSFCLGLYNSTVVGMRTDWRVAGQVNIVVGPTVDIKSTHSYTGAEAMELVGEKMHTLGNWVKTHLTSNTQAVEQNTVAAEENHESGQFNGLAAALSLESGEANSVAGIRSEESGVSNVVFGERSEEGTSSTAVVASRSESGLSMDQQFENLLAMFMAAEVAGVSRDDSVAAVTESGARTVL